ncbi:MAG TPA: hypothetical protein VGI99_00730, partial [Gemmataceae bacterium]
MAARDLFSTTGKVVWQRPRFEAPGKPPLLLKDYASFGPAFEVDYAVLFANTAKYLASAAAKGSPEELAKQHGLDVEFLKRWIELLALETASTEFTKPLRTIPAAALTLLEDRLPKDPNQPAINGWHKRGTDLPVAVSNASDKVERIPGTVQPHGIAVHPMPQESVAAAWTSPIDAAVEIAATVNHAHPACGNGVAYRIEHRRGKTAGILSEGTVDLGKEAKLAPVTAKVQKGDVVLLVVDARDGSHVCDMTDIAFSIVETAKPERKWDLAKDVADSILDGNPHADSHGNKAVWSFVRGPSIKSAKNGPAIPPGSLLARWQVAARDPARHDDAAKLAAEVQKLLTGPRPGNDKSLDRRLYDNLVSTDSILLHGLDVHRLGPPKSGGFGLEKALFMGSNFAAEADGKGIVIRLPAGLLRDREFVVEAKVDQPDRAVQVQVGSLVSWDAKSPLLAVPGGPAHKKLLAGFGEFRRLFPPFLCFQQVIPTDETVSLKMFHREDEPLRRLFLSPEQTRQIDRLWAEHRFISRQPLA